MSHTTGVWSYNGMTPVRAIEGARMLGSNYGIGYDFETAQHSFGGYFASITGEAGGQIRFYQGEALLGSEAIVAPIGNEWAWNGWSVKLDRINPDGRLAVYHTDSRGQRYAATIRPDQVRWGPPPPMQRRR